MTAFSAFYDLVMPELPGCTTQMVDLQLRQVARDFCHRGRVWRGDFTPISTVALQASYAIAPADTTASLVQVHKLTIGTDLLWDTTWHEANDVDSDEPEYRVNAPFSLSDDLLTLTLCADEIPEAAAVAAITGICSMQPKQDAATLPDLLYLVHSDAMRAGVLARLMMMGKKPWTSAAGAMYRSEYEAKLQHAATTAQRGNHRSLLRTRRTVT